ncbi:MAG: hypothetical protein SOR77_02735 [Peptoniphilus sp.]|uniref:hypothetical protein n=1 Tax=Peptoniphilus sp. TaxID=1971214 RepID=UPI002A766A44|nr:hypothetical protein [Peptoniphilus sp.]MDY2986533.1 hypothetical protein [Peptoniphilus sp.]
MKRFFTIISNLTVYYLIMSKIIQGYNIVCSLIALLVWQVLNYILIKKKIFIKPSNYKWKKYIQVSLGFSILLTYQLNSMYGSLGNEIGMLIMLILIGILLM